MVGNTMGEFAIIYPPFLGGFGIVFAAQNRLVDAGVLPHGEPNITLTIVYAIMMIATSLGLGFGTAALVWPEFRHIGDGHTH